MEGPVQARACSDTSRSRREQLLIVGFTLTVNTYQIFEHHNQTVAEVKFNFLTFFSETDPE